MTNVETPENATLPKTTAAAETFAEHKALREKRETAQPEEKKPPKEPEGEEPKTGEASEATKKDSQEQPKEEKPKKDRSFEGRISELTAARRKAEQEAEELRRQLAEMRGSRPAAQEQPKQETKPAAAEAKADEDPKPRLKDFLAQAKEGQSYEDIQEQYEDAVYEWRTRQSKRQEESARLERTKTQQREDYNRRLTAARQKYADFDEVTKGDAASGTGLILSEPMMRYAVVREAGLDVIYYLGQHPEAAAHIRSMPAEEQLEELGYIARTLKKASAAKPETEPEKPKPPVSRVPPPPRPVNGTSAAEPKSTSEARSMAEHRRMRAQQGRG